MRKIPTMFHRGCDGLVVNELTVGCGWVLAGEGVATLKFDGTCCLIRGGRLFKRHEVKFIRPMQVAATNRVVPEKPLPDGFEPADEYDPVTRKQVGWVPVGDGPEDQWHREARDRFLDENGQLESFPPQFLPEADGTYELCGPKIQGNPESRPYHELIEHGCVILPDAPRSFDGLKGFLAVENIEGLVFWRDINDPNCEKAKIKKKDFGLKRGER